VALATLPDMRFRWDWLRPAVHAPYVPTLGPVQPGALSAEIFDAIMSVAGTGRFLPYDKDQRWSARKEEQVIAGEVIHRPDLTVIPTLSARGGGVVKIHYYGTGVPGPDEAAGWSRKWCTSCGAAASTLIWLQDNPRGARTRLMLKTYGDQDRTGDDGCVTELGHCHVADTFRAFACQLAADGFAFLHQRMKAGLSDGPVLVAVDDRRIVGAVGPLVTMTDAVGTRTVPPQYYAVHPDYRRRGHGRALWRASMAWGHKNGAAYKVLQAAAGAPSERLYQSEGLVTLGFLCSRKLN
jgi:GNAT superfamily N-acetyltransferase